MIASDIQKAYNQTKWALLLRGLLSLTVGIAIIMRPMSSVLALALVIAFWSLFDGIVGIVRSFELRGIVQHWWVMLLGGFVGVAFGVAALYYFPGLSLTFAVVWTSYWLTISGVIGAYVAWQERTVGLSWGWTMAFAVIAIAAGVIAFMSPAATLATLLGVLAGFAIISGVFLLIAAFRMGSVQRDIRQSVPNAARI
jgi:uncharacterized membrane protein HdeD (DUF308 family)